MKNERVIGVAMSDVDPNLDIVVISYGTGRSFFVRVNGKALRTKNGKGPRLFRSKEAAAEAGEKHYNARKK